MLLGQYSTGKTTFIKHLLRANYPGKGKWNFSMLILSLNSLLFVFGFFLGAHIGPEPTTDRFVVVMVCYSVNEMLTSCSA